MNKILSKEWIKGLKYVNQLNYAHIPYPTRTDNDKDEYGKTTNVETSGCGLASSVMVAHYLLEDCDFEIEDAVNLSIKTGANHGIGTDYKIYSKVFSEKLGLSVESNRNIEHLKECLKNNLIPFIIEDSKKGFYYRGLSEWRNEKDWLIDTCLDGQDTFIRLLDMLDIPHNS